jgi:dTMP kinase
LRDRRHPAPGERRDLFRHVVAAPLHVALEGIDGSGKSTLIDRVAAVMAAGPVTVEVVRYTQKTGWLGRLMRSLYGAPHVPWPVRVIRRQRFIQATLYAMNGRKNLRKSLGGADLVLGDRSVVCSYASHWGLLPTWFLDLIESRNVPNVVVLLDLEPAVAHQRLVLRGGAGYEEDLSALQLFRRQYQELVESPPPRLRGVAVRRCAADRPVDEVTADVVRVIHDELNRHRSDR